MEHIGTERSAGSSKTGPHIDFKLLCAMTQVNVAGRVKATVSRGEQTTTAKVKFDFKYPFIVPEGLLEQDERAILTEYFMQNEYKLEDVNIAALDEIVESAFPDLSARALARITKKLKQHKRNISPSEL